MKKLDLSQVPKDLKPNPVFDGMSESLKDPACFEGIEKRLADTVRTAHRHRTVAAYVRCRPCSGNRLKRQSLMKEMGFQGIAQYLEWKKVMTIIRDKKDFQVR